MTHDEAMRCYDEVAAAPHDSPLLRTVVRGRESGPGVMSAAGWLTFGRAVGELYRLWDLMCVWDKAARSSWAAWRGTRCWTTPPPWPRGEG